MPVYNARQYLAEAIESILQQTYSDWELIVVNDGSTDDSGAIARSFEDNRIRYYENETNMGLIYTRNRLISKASGEYISFLDSDDVAMPQRLEKQMAFLDNNPNYAMCGTWAYMIDGSGRRIKKINLSRPFRQIKPSLLFANSFLQSSVMIRRSVSLDNQYDTAFPLAEDYELWCRLARKYKLYNIPAKLTCYRWHETNISQEKQEALLSNVWRIQKRELQHIGIVPSDEEMAIHVSISNKGVSAIDDSSYLDKLKGWMRILKAANKKAKYYDQAYFEATICFRWIFACKERKKYTQALLLPFAVTPKVILSLFCMLWDRAK